MLQYNAQMQRKPPASNLASHGRPSFSTIQAQPNPQPAMTSKSGGKPHTNRQPAKQAQPSSQGYKGRTTRTQATGNQFHDPRTLYPVQLSNERSGSNENRKQTGTLPPQIYHQSQYPDFDYQRQMMRQSPEIQNLPQNISMTSNLHDRHMNTNPQQYYRYLEELNQYPPAQQKVLIETYSQQSPSKMASQPPIHDFQSHSYMLKESSNPRFDLPRQIMQQNYMDAATQQRQSQPIRMSENQSSGKRELLEKYYSSKYESQANSSDIQKFIDFYKHFSSQQAQNIAQSRETPQPLQQQSLGHQSPSSDSSDQKIQQMLMHMKKDVEECKQFFMKEKRSLSDRGSSNRREHSRGPWSRRPKRRRHKEKRT